MTRIQLTASDIWYHLDPDTGINIYDREGTAWRRSISDHAGGRSHARVGTVDTWWTPEDDDPVWIDPPAVPEPPDLTRIEFEYGTDVYAAWRDDASSAAAGWTAGNGGEVWCMFGSACPRSWAIMWLEFGDSLATAVRLVPHPDDVGNYAKWPTAMMAKAKR